jgi:hypothetical protein
MLARRTLRKRAVIILLACASPVLAADRYWTGGGGADQDWSIPANWSGVAVPTLSDPAYIGSTSLSPASAFVTQPGETSQNLYLGYGGPYAGSPL